MRGQLETVASALAAVATGLRILTDVGIKLIDGCVGFVILLIAFSTVKDVIFYNDNLVLSLIQNTNIVFSALLTETKISDIQNIHPFDFFVGTNGLLNTPLLLLLKLVNIYKLFLFINIIFFKLGALVLQWYMFVYSIAIPILFKYPKEQQFKFYKTPSYYPTKQQY